MAGSLQISMPFQPATASKFAHCQFADAMLASHSQQNSHIANLQMLFQLAAQTSQLQPSNSHIANLQVLFQLAIASSKNLKVSQLAGAIKFAHCEFADTVLAAQINQLAAAIKFAHCKFADAVLASQINQLAAAIKFAHCEFADTVLASQINQLATAIKFVHCEFADAVLASYSYLNKFASSASSLSSQLATAIKFVHCEFADALQLAIASSANSHSNLRANLQIYEVARPICREFACEFANTHCSASQPGLQICDREKIPLQLASIFLMLQLCCEFVALFVEASQPNDATIHLVIDKIQ